MAEQIITDFITVFSLLLGDCIEYFSNFLVTNISKGTHPIFSQLVFWWNSCQSCNQRLKPGLAGLSSWITAKLR